MLGRRLQRDKIVARQSWQLASGFDSVRGGTDGLLNESILPQPLRYPILRYSPKGENRMSTHDRLAQGYAQSNERSGYFPTMQTAPEELPPIATVLADVWGVVWKAGVGAFVAYKVNEALRKGSRRR